MRLGSLLLALTASLAGQALHRSPINRTRVIRQLEAQERQIRGLQQLYPVRVRFLAPKPFKALITAQLKHDERPSDIAVSQRELNELGFLDPGQSYRKILFSGLASQPIGVYDDKSKTLYVRNQNNQALKLERYVIVHEYTHALQDQHWNLNKIMPDNYKQTYRNSDAIIAHRALVEGDAFNVQTIYINRSYTPAQFRGLVAYENKIPTPQLPWAIQTDFYFPYTAGTKFVQMLQARGGMQKVNRAFTRLPSSTYEILFPSAYLSGWRPEPVSLRRISGLAGWKRVDDDVFGALEFDMLLAQRGSPADARSVVQGYRGDRYLFLERGASNLLLIDSRWDSAVAAKAAKDAIARSLTQRFGPSASWNATHTIVRAGSMAVSVTSSGAKVKLVYAPTSALAAKAATAATS